MNQNIKKLTMLLFVAASMMAVSCSKVNDGKYSENDIIGVWYFPSDIGYDQMRSGKLDIKSDHTVEIKSDYGWMTMEWTFEDDQFTATFTRDQYTGVLSFKVKEVTSEHMIVEGDYRMNGNVLGGVSGTLRHNQ